MSDFREFIEKYIDEDLKRIVISSPRKGEGASKIQVRPILLKGNLCFQATRRVGAQEFHENYEKEALKALLIQEMEQNFKQLQLESRRAQGTVLVSKKGKMTVREKEIQGKAREEFPQILSHNRQKNYLLKEGEPIPWLVDLGVMSQEGKIKNAKYDKFKQLNRFLEVIEDILPRLPREREVRIIDFGCGKSYLTFAMYYYLHEIRQYDIRITGLDLKADVIEKCQRLAEKYGYEKLDFMQGDIASYEGEKQADMVVTLHACDTATDYALAKAVNWGASVILSVPCCQHELNGQIQNETLAPVLQYGILKERISALLTDGLRGQILESVGYDTQILEFIDMEHTPKNLLIRAVKSQKKKENLPALEACIQALGADLTLCRLLYGQKRKDSK